MNGKPLTRCGLEAKQCGNDVLVELCAGEWQFTYQPTCDYLIFFSSKTPLNELLRNQKAVDTILPLLPEHLRNINPDELGHFTGTSLREVLMSPLAGELTEEMLDRIDAALREVTVE